MMEKITAAIEERYNHIDDAFIFLHEDKLENVMFNGRFQSEIPKFKDALKKAAPDTGLVLASDEGA